MDSALDRTYPIELEDYASSMTKSSRQRHTSSELQHTCLDNCAGRNEVAGSDMSGSNRIRMTG